MYNFSFILPDSGKIYNEKIQPFYLQLALPHDAILEAIEAI